MRLLRRIAASILSFVAGLGVLFSGAPPELAGITAASIGLFVEGVLPEVRSREQVLADEAHRTERSRAFEGYGAAIALIWQSAGMMNTFRPKIVGYVHGLATLVRSQRRFEEQVAAATSSLSSILLYGSTETQNAAIEVFRTLSAKLAEVSRSGKQGSKEIRAAYEIASAEVGDKVVVWRQAAQADLGLAESPPN